MDGMDIAIIDKIVADVFNDSPMCSDAEAEEEIKNVQQQDILIKDSLAFSDDEESDDFYLDSYEQARKRVKTRSEMERDLELIIGTPRSTIRRQLLEQTLRDGIKISKIVNNVTKVSNINKDNKRIIKYSDTKLRNSNDTGNNNEYIDSNCTKVVSKENVIKTNTTSLDKSTSNKTKEARKEIDDLALLKPTICETPNVTSLMSNDDNKTENEPIHNSSVEDTNEKIATGQSCVHLCEQEQDEVFYELPSCSSPDINIDKNPTNNAKSQFLNGCTTPKQTKSFNSKSATQPIRGGSSSANTTPKMSFYQKFIQLNSQTLSQSAKFEAFQCPYCMHGFISFAKLESHVSVCSKKT